MKKILFLGSSHVGALRIGDKKNLLSELFSFASSYIGIPGRGGFYRLRLRGHNLIVSKTYEKFTDIDDQACKIDTSINIDLTYFDHIIFVAGFCRLDSRLYYSNSISHIPLLSRSVLKEVILQNTLQDREKSHELPPLFWEILGMRSTCITFLGAPLLSSDACPFLELSIQCKANLLRNSEQVRSLCNEANDQQGKPLILLPPASFLDDTGVFTRGLYFENSVNWAGEAKKGFKQSRDLTHVNASYGRSILEQTVFPALNKV